MKSVFCGLALTTLLLAGCATPPAPEASTEPAPVELSPRDALNERVSHYASLYDVPETLIHRVIQRESTYDPAKHNGRYWGLMQIRLDTARTVGYRGTARGLLDADTNLKYAVAYLSNAYMVAGGNQDRGLALYVSGYYYEARRKGLLDRLKTAHDE
jgi:soluble lytic murein transglycosylase-like protein